MRLLFLLAFFALSATSATLTVTSNADSGPGSLRKAVADAAPGDTIQLNGLRVELTTGEIVIDKDLTIDGGSPQSAISAPLSGKQFRIFFILRGTVAIRKVDFSNGWAQGSDGYTFLQGGGGGGAAGLGGCIFVNTGVNATITDSRFSFCQARGGAGAAGRVGSIAGGGGGIGGSGYNDGGDGGALGGKGGLYGPKFPIWDSTSKAGDGGDGAGGGGGFNLAAGGDGGFGGGGGGGAQLRGGTGGFGGGGGGGTSGAGGEYGGSGTVALAGGGAGLGGAIFVRSGGSLTLSGAISMAFVRATGGTGSGTGEGRGAAVFAMAGSTVNLAAATISAFSSSNVTSSPGRGTACPSNLETLSFCGVPSPGLKTMTIVDGNNQTSGSFSEYSKRLQVQVKNPDGSPAAGVDVTFYADPNPTIPSVAGGSSRVTTDSSGIAVAPALSGNGVIGKFVVEALIANQQQTGVLFLLENILAPPASVSVSSGNNQSVALGSNYQPLGAVVRDAQGNLLGNIAVTFAAPAATFPSARFSGSSSTTVSTDSSGIASTGAFSPASGTTGTFQVTATVSGVATPATFTLTSTAGPPAALALSGGNQSAALLTAFPSPVVATVTDASGNPVPGATVTFSTPSPGASGTFLAADGSTVASVMTDSSGRVAAPQTFANATIGSWSMSASVLNGQGQRTSGSVAMTNVPGSPAVMQLVAGSPQSAQISTAYATPFQVRLLDARGKPAAGATVAFSAPLIAATGRFSGSGMVVADSSGVATAPVFTANALPGSFVVTASASPNLTQTFSLTNTATAPATLTPVAGTPQRAVIQLPAPTNFSVRVNDGTGAVVPNLPVTFTAPAQGASGLFAGSVFAVTVNTNASGIATAPAFTPNSATGLYYVVASAGATSASFAVTNVFATLTAVAGATQTTTFGTLFPTALQVKVTDANGSAIANWPVLFSPAPNQTYYGTFSPGGSPGGSPGAQRLAQVLTDSQGVATAPPFTDAGVGGRNVTASYSLVASALGGSARFALAATPEEATCGYTVAPSTIPVFPAAGGTVTLAVQSSTTSCRWGAGGNDPWVTALPAFSAVSSANLRVTVNPWSGTGTRMGSVTIAGQRMPITQTGSSDTADRRFVRLLYTGVLGRAPSSTELDFHVSTLGTRTDKYLDFLRSFESAVYARFAAGLYAGLLNRDADFTGWQLQRGVLSSAQATQLGLVSNFLSSAEYAISFGAPSNDEFIRLLYRYVLRREASASEVTYHVGNLGLGRPTIANLFLNSEEFRVNMSTRLTVFLSYATLLDREPSPPEMAIALERIGAGVSIRTLADEIISGAELAARLQ